MKKPPNANPFIAITTGFSKFSIISKICGIVGPLFCPNLLNSLISAPETKNFPFPVTTIALTFLSLFACYFLKVKNTCKNFNKGSVILIDNAFTGGFFIVKTITSSCFSTPTNSLL
jgi:hypothetical protein